jgi:hypothetical protein
VVVLVPVIFELSSALRRLRLLLPAQFLRAGNDGRGARDYMRPRQRAAVAALIVAGQTTAAAAGARAPDDPAAAVPEIRYAPVMRGARAYRPVEPKPWGAINERVAPKDARRPANPSQKTEGR